MSKFLCLQLSSLGDQDLQQFEELCWFSYEYDKRIAVPSLQQDGRPSSRLDPEEEEDSSGDEPGLAIVEPSPEAEGGDELDMLSDIPPEALSAHTRVEFVQHMRPYVWVKYPSATALEINAFINARWSLLKASRKMAAGEREL